MESNSAETAVVDSTRIIAEHLLNMISQYVNTQQVSTNAQLFQFLALLNAYVPESFLLMSECQRILGPPDPIHGGPPFEERMEPFTALINTSSPRPDHVSLINQATALEVVNLLAYLGITRSDTVKKLMCLLCGDRTEPHTVQNVKDLLTKREMGENGKERFSTLIKDILEKENFYHAVSVLKTASKKFRQNAMYPQTLSRLYYSGRKNSNFENAERWAKTAIIRAPRNSYVADTLGQIYKNRLRKTQAVEIRGVAEHTFRLFKDVEEKAEKEEGPEMTDIAGHERISNFFNNRGRFGFIQVAKIVFEKSRERVRWPSQELHTIQGLIQNNKIKVEAMFEFFEWYLTYSKPSLTTWEPYYFWRDVALCYKYYTGQTAAESTSFAGLLDCLNHGLFVSKGRRAKLNEVEKNASDLEKIQNDLKITYEQDLDTVKVVERYILSNIILSNKMSTSYLASVVELKQIIFRFLGTEIRRRSPEFYLLVLLLFWPEKQALRVQDDEEEFQATVDNGSDNNTWEDRVSEEETVQLPLDLIPVPDLEQYATFLKTAFERAEYAKYLRGRYLLPLFFLGKGSGLSKWIHKSTIDAIVERKVDTELDGEYHDKNKKKVIRINDMWTKGEVWQVPDVKDILLPVAVEPCHSPMTPQNVGEGDTVQHMQQSKEVFVCAGGKKIKATIAAESDDSTRSTMLFYLAFTIQGAVVFKVGSPCMFG